MRLAILIVATVAVLAAAACAPNVSFEPRAGASGGNGDLTVAAQARGGWWLVIVPDGARSAGIEVRRASGPPFHVPPGHLPPPGACRVWRDGVPPGRQDPPGPCDELERTVPAEAYLLRG